jgi:hypothetical protein
MGINSNRAPSGHRPSAGAPTNIAPNTVTNRNHFYFVKQLTGLLLNQSPTRKDNKLEGIKVDSEMQI